MLFIIILIKSKQYVPQLTTQSNVMIIILLYIKGAKIQNKLDKCEFFCPLKGVSRLCLHISKAP